MNWLSDRESITEASAFAVDINAEKAVMCFETRFYGHLIESLGLFDAEKAPGIAGGLEGKIDDDIVLYRCCFGAPAAGLHLEALIASGVSTVMMAGEGGSISADLPIGSIVIPTWGIREEGTSYHYLPPQDTVHPSESLLQQIEESIGAEGSARGGVWTTDAGLRETTDKVIEYAERGIVTVDMECTALMAIAIFREVEFTAVLVVTDELFDGRWDRSFGSREVEVAKKHVAESIARVLH